MVSINGVYRAFYLPFDYVYIVTSIFVSHAGKGSWAKPAI